MKNCANGGSVSQSDLFRLFDILKPKGSRFEKIRVGDNCDGGYVVDNVFDVIGGVISIGIGWQVSFDKYFASRGINVFQFDHTIEQAPCAHEFLHWRKLGWGVGDGFASLSEMLGPLIDRDDLVLKFDVEGAEWDCLIDVTPELLKKFKVIVCELHGFFHLEDYFHFRKVKSALDLLSSGHTATHLHANNCRQLKCVFGIPVPTAFEVTFIRNDLGPFDVSHTENGALDFPSDPSQPEVFPGFWGVK